MDIQISRHARDKALERIGPNTDLIAIWRKSLIAQTEHFRIFHMWEFDGFEYRVAEYQAQNYMLVIDALDQRVVTIVKEGGHCGQSSKPR
jgi:hypothetical protein